MKRRSTERWPRINAKYANQFFISDSYAFAKFAASFALANCYLLGALLHNCVITIARQTSAHGFSISPVTERPNLHMKQWIAGRVCDEDRILLFAQRCNQDLSIFLFRDGCHLHHE